MSKKTKVSLTVCIGLIVSCFAATGIYTNVAGNYIDNIDNSYVIQNLIRYTNKDFSVNINIDKADKSTDNLYSSLTEGKSNEEAMASIDKYITINKIKLFSLSTVAALLFGGLGAFCASLLKEGSKSQLKYD